MAKMRIMDSSIKIHNSKGFSSKFSDNFSFCYGTPLKDLTSRDRPKSAPYLSLKNRKRTSKSQSIIFYSAQNKILKKVSQCRKKLKVGPFGIFQHPFCRKTPKKFEGHFGEIFSGNIVSQCRKD